MRNEFIGLKLIDVLKSLRSRGVSDDLVVQLDVFEEQRESDEEHIKGRGCQFRLYWTPAFSKLASILQIISLAV